MSGDGWRYIAQRLNGSNGELGTFIDFNVPLMDVSLEDVLSGHNALTGKIAPEYARLKDAEGKPLLTEWSTAIWAEDPDGEIRGGGLLTHSAFNDQGEWQLECTDLTGTAIELPYDSAHWFVNVDPIDIFRIIWLHIQSHQNQNFGITIDPTTSPVRLGSDLVQRVEFDTEEDVTEDLEEAPMATAPPRYSTNALWVDAGVKAMKAVGWKGEKVRDALAKWINKDALTEQGKWKRLTDEERTIRDRTIEKIGWPPNPPNPGRNSITNVFNVRPQMNPPEGGEVIPETEDPTDNPTYQYEAYKLNWYETLDLAAEIDNLSSQTPFDWHLTHRWEGDELRHHIRVGYPRLGRRREDLRFVVGENIAQAPTLERDGMEFANEIVVFGAGEGSGMIVGRAFRRDDRVRRVMTISDPSLTTQLAANLRAEQELAKRFLVDDVTEIVMENHPHAPMGSVDLGDEIFVEGDLGWVDFGHWCRVIGRTMSPDSGDQQILTLIRADRIA